MSASNVFGAVCSLFFWLCIVGFLFKLFRSSSREKAEVKSYQIVKVGDDLAIECRICGYVSFNQNDVKRRFCGNCLMYHEISEARRK